MSNQWTGITPEQRFHKKVVVASEAGCWAWTGAHDTRGYGLLWLDGRFVGAHRFSYELYVGRIPNDLEIDHLCRNKGCVNPTHLEPVTHRENSVRALPYKRVARGPRVAYCIKGHLYTAENTKPLPGGRRMCRICANERNRVYRSRRRDELLRELRP